MTPEDAKPKSYPRTIRAFVGNHPDQEALDNGAFLAAVHPCPLRWHLYVMSIGETPGGRWYNIKLVADHVAPAKANYWFSYSPTRDRFNASADAGKCSRLLPEMLNWIRRAISTLDADLAQEPAPDPAPKTRPYALALGDRCAVATRCSGLVDLESAKLKVQKRSPRSTPNKNRPTLAKVKGTRSPATKPKKEPTLAESNLALDIFS